MTGDSHTQPDCAAVCCYCDAYLSCAQCGMEQPATPAQPAGMRAMIIEECAKVCENRIHLDNDAEYGHYAPYNAEAKACANDIRALPAERPAVAQAAPDCGDDENRMEKISALIARLQSVLDRWGDTCVYIRRGGLSWGAVALNRQDDDKKHGVFDLQAQHDRDMLERLGQVERLKKDRDEWRQKVWDAEAKASPLSSTVRGTP